MAATHAAPARFPVTVDVVALTVLGVALFATGVGPPRHASGTARSQAQVTAANPSSGVETHPTPGMQ